MPLAEHQAEQIDDHIGRQNSSSRLVGGKIVEPAFQRHDHAGRAEAERAAHEKPDHGLGVERLEEYHCCSKRSPNRKGADVAHTRQQPWAGETADYEARVVKRPHRADGDAGKPVELGAQRRQRADEPVAEQQERGRKKNGSDGKELRAHEAPVGR
jgi:hypothetical protein